MLEYFANKNMYKYETKLRYFNVDFPDTNLLVPT